MHQKKRSYQNKKWHIFSNDVKYRDSYRCLKCNRSSDEAILQVHHKRYKPNLDPWEYAISDCITLCKGCHAREHNLIEPNRGWTLLSIDDLGDLIGTCQRKGCGSEIRYEHLTYHPQWGYKIVGSTCVEYLTREDQMISFEVLKLLKNISSFLNKVELSTQETQNGKPYILAMHKHHQIRIYGKQGSYTYQIALKVKGVKYFEFQDFQKVKDNRKSLIQVLEIAYIVLKGMITDDEIEKETLRSIYRGII